MKLLEKLKNTFFEEEYVEVEVKPKAVAKKVEAKPVKKELPKRETRIKEEPIEEEEEIEEDLEEETPMIHYSDSELVKDTKLPYFEDDDFMNPDFVEEEKVEEEPKTVYGGSVEQLYSSISYDENSYNTPYGATNKGAFKPTPIISPIYGILDKNYKKEEVVDKKETDSYIARANVDLDSIRNKAYGVDSTINDVKDTFEEEDNFEEEVEEVILKQEATEPIESNLLYDMTDEDKVPSVDQVTIADAEEYFEDLGLEYNIDYKDTHYEKATGRRTSKKKKEVEIEDDDSNLEDNMFDVIDSMYEEGEEE